jgi:hypothetical protein
VPHPPAARCGARLNARLPQVRQVHRLEVNFLTKSYLITVFFNYIDYCIIGLSWTTCSVGIAVI